MLVMPSRRVARCLFGPVDHDEQRKFIRKQLEEIESQDRSRWNFDFKKQCPLPGKYVWQKVEDQEVPEAYRMPHLDRATPVRHPPHTVTSTVTSQEDSEQTEKENLHSHRCATPPCSEALVTPPSSPSSSQMLDAGNPTQHSTNTRKRKQSHITGRFTFVYI